MQPQRSDWAPRILRNLASGFAYLALRFYPWPTDPYFRKTNPIPGIFPTAAGAAARERMVAV